MTEDEPNKKRTLFNEYEAYTPEAYALAEGLAAPSLGDDDD